MGNCLLEKPVRFLSSQIRRVLTFVVDWWCTISRHSRVEVLVGVRVEEEIRAIKPPGKRFVIIINGMLIPELANVVSIIIGGLEPMRQVILVDTLVDYFGISTVRSPYISDLRIINLSAWIC